jgi:hypothetical protein
MGSGGGAFPGVKRPEREANHSPPSSVVVTNVGTISSLPPYVVMIYLVLV